MFRHKPSLGNWRGNFLFGLPLSSNLVLSSERCSWSTCQFYYSPKNDSNEPSLSPLVPATGLEPARLAAYAPKAYVYTNFTTRAYLYFNTKTGFFKAFSGKS